LNAITRIGKYKYEVLQETAEALKLAVPYVFGKVKGNFACWVPKSQLKGDKIPDWILNRRLVEIRQKNPTARTDKWILTYHI
jgi:hypothetical protein